MQVRLLVSVASGSTVDFSMCNVPGTTLEVRRRRTDWGLKGPAKYLHHICEAVKVVLAARRHDALILCTVSIEAFLVAGLRWISGRHLRLVLFDVLIPQQRRLDPILGLLLRRADAIAVIRTGDAGTFGRRFGVPPERCVFVPFPAPSGLQVASEPTSGTATEPFIYSAGWAHRDWPTLVTALASLPYRAILCPGRPVDVPEAARDRIEIRPMPSPEQGRLLMARATLVVLALAETELPSGPLVLLDAMAMGKPVVATRVNGTRDYVTDGTDGLLVRPRDPDALREAIERAMSSDELRRKLSAAATRAASAWDACRVIIAIAELARPPEVPQK
jgi:glycosyltransferase involved in cell wall biosynthesis